MEMAGLSVHSGVIDVERQNSTKKLMVNSKRMGLDDETVDKLLRIYCNSPGVKEPGFKE